MASLTRPGRMPQVLGCRALVSLALRKADELALHSPRCKEVHPGLTCAWTGVTLPRLAENAGPVLAQGRQRRAEVVDIEREMMAADVAVLGRLATLIRGAVYENLEVRAVATPQQSHCPGDRA